MGSSKRQPFCIWCTDSMLQKSGDFFGSLSLVVTLIPIIWDTTGFGIPSQKTNSSPPENGPLEKEIPIGKQHFKGLC